MSVEDANHPVFIFDDSATSGSFGVTVFQTFIHGAPPLTKFNPPESCS